MEDYEIEITEGYNINEVSVIKLEKEGSKDWEKTDISSEKTGRQAQTYINIKINCDPDYNINWQSEEGKKFALGFEDIRKFSEKDNFDIHTRSTGKNR